MSGAEFTVGQSRGIAGMPVPGLSCVAAAPITAASIVIPGNNRPLVTIHPDGRLEFGEGYEPDEAARAFWDAVQRLAPGALS